MLHFYISHGCDFSVAFLWQGSMPVIIDLEQRLEYRQLDA